MKILKIPIFCDGSVEFKNLQSHSGDLEFSAHFLDSLSAISIDHSWVQRLNFLLIEFDNSCDNEWVDVCLTTIQENEVDKGGDL